MKYILLIIIILSATFLAGFVSIDRGSFFMGLWFGFLLGVLFE